ncbi:MAG: hypothetical protein U0Z17_07410 [Bacteroidales bacterium]
MISTTATSRQPWLLAQPAGHRYCSNRSMQPRNNQCWLMAAFWVQVVPSQTWTANFTDACNNVADEKVITYTWTESLVKPVISARLPAMTLVVTQPWTPRYLP